MVRSLPAIALLAILSHGVEAQSRVVVPAEVQLSLFRRIWTLDRTFPRRTPVVFAIAYQRLYRESFVAKEELLAAGRGADGIRFVPIDLDASGSIEERLQGVDVVYLAPLRAVDLPKFIALTRPRGIRTVSGVPEYVHRGAAVSITAERNRPVILINLEAARAEGADFSSQLLKVARIVR